MFAINNPAQAKKSATALRKALTPLGLELTRSATYEVLAKVAGFGDWNAMAAALRQPQAAQVPLASPSQTSHVITDVEFSAVTAVRLDGEFYDVHSLEEDVLKWLGDWRNPANPYLDDASVTAIHLLREDDGLLFDEELSAEQLLNLAWDASKEAFVLDDGAEYAFYFRVKFGQAADFSKKSQPQPELPEGYRVYRTLLGTYRWTYGTIYDADKSIDGPNLTFRQEAVQDAWKHHNAKGKMRLLQAAEQFSDIAAQCGPVEKRALAIKKAYLDSFCTRKDVDDALERLDKECGALFYTPTQAWEFLMDETHEDNETSDSSEGDVMFERSKAIKLDYLNSGRSRSDLEGAIKALLEECGELFGGDESATEFLLDEGDDE